MKKILIIVLSTAFVLSLGISEQYWITNDFQELQTRTESLLEGANTHTLTDEEMEETNDWWTNKKRFMHIFIPHDEIRDVDYWLSEAQGYIHTRNYDLAYAQLNKMLDAAKTIPTAFRFRFENVF